MAKGERKVVNFEETYRKIDELANYDGSKLNEISNEIIINTETLQSLSSELESIQKSIDRAQKISTTFQGLISSLDREKIDYEDLDPEVFNADVRILHDKALNIVHSIESFLQSEEDINNKSKNYKERIAEIKKSVKELNTIIVETNEKYEKEYQKKVKSAILRSYLEAGNVSFLPSSKELLDFMMQFKDGKGQQMFDEGEFCNIIDIFMLKKSIEKKDNNDTEEKYEIVSSKESDEEITFNPFALVVSEEEETIESAVPEDIELETEKPEDDSSEDFSPTFIDIDSIETEEHELSDETTETVEKEQENEAEIPKIIEELLPEEKSERSKAVEKIVSFGKNAADVEMINDALNDVDIEHIEKINKMLVDADIDLENVGLIIYLYTEEEVDNYIENVKFAKENGLLGNFAKYPISAASVPVDIAKSKIETAKIYGIEIKSEVDYIAIINNDFEPKIVAAIEMGANEILEDLKKYPISKMVFPTNDKIEARKKEMRETLNVRFEGTGILETIDNTPISEDLGMDEFQKLIDLQTKMLTTISNQEKSNEGCYVVVDSDGKEITIPKSRVNENLKIMVNAKFDNNIMSDELMIFLACVYGSSRDFTDAIELEATITERVGKEL